MTWKTPLGNYAVVINSDASVIDNPAACRQDAFVCVGIMVQISFHVIPLRFIILDNHGIITHNDLQRFSNQHEWRKHHLSQCITRPTLSPEYFGPKRAVPLFLCSKTPTANPLWLKTALWLGLSFHPVETAIAGRFLASGAQAPIHSVKTLPTGLTVPRNRFHHLTSRH